MHSHGLRNPRLDFPDSRNHGVGNQLESSYLDDAVADSFALWPCKQMLEYPAHVCQAYDRNVPVGSGISSLNSRDIMRSFTSRRSTAPSRVGYRRDLKTQRKRFSSSLRIPLAHQAVKGRLPDVSGLAAEELYPVTGIMLLLGGADVAQCRIKQIISGGFGVRDKELLWIGVDSAFEGKVHQYCAGKRKTDGMFGNMNELSALIFQHQKNDFFSESQQCLILPVFRQSLTGLIRCFPAP